MRHARIIFELLGLALAMLAIVWAMPAIVYITMGVR